MAELQATVRTMAAESARVVEQIASVLEGQAEAHRRVCARLDHLEAAVRVLELHDRQLTAAVARLQDSDEYWETLSDVESPTNG